jgi:anti-sigma B factor antagonist
MGNVAAVTSYDSDSLPSPEELLVIDQARIGEATVITLTGDVDSATAPLLLQAVLDALAAPGSGPVVIDMTHVSFLSSAGLGALVAAYHRAGQHGEPLRVVVDHARPVLRPLQLSGLDQVLTLFHFLGTALHGDPAAEGHDGDAGDVDAAAGAG